MVNNTDIVWENDTGLLKIGGALSFKGESLYINSSLFRRNNALVGGAISIDALNHFDQSFLIENSVFQENFGGNGGAIAVDISVMKLKGIIRNNYFKGNWGGSKPKFLVFIMFFS